MTHHVAGNESRGWERLPACPHAQAGALGISHGNHFCFTGANLGRSPPSNAHPDLAGETRKAGGSPVSEKGMFPCTISFID